MFIVGIIIDEDEDDLNTIKEKYINHKIDTSDF